MAVFTRKEERVFQEVLSLGYAFGYGVQRFPEMSDRNIQLVQEAARIWSDKLHLLPGNEELFQERLDGITAAAKAMGLRPGASGS